MTVPDSYMSKYAYIRTNACTYLCEDVCTYVRTCLQWGVEEDSCKGRCMCFSIYFSREEAVQGAVGSNDDGYSSNMSFSRVYEGETDNIGSKRDKKGRLGMRIHGLCEIDNEWHEWKYVRPSNNPEEAIKPRRSYADPRD